MKVAYAFFAKAAVAEGSTFSAISADFDKLTTEVFPSSINISVIIKFLYAPEECGRPHDLSGVFKSPDGRELNPFKGQLQFSHPQSANEKKEFGLLICTNLPGLKLETPGNYEFNLIVSNGVTVRLPLEVEEKKVAPSK